MKMRNMADSLFNPVELGVLALGMLHWAPGHSPVAFFCVCVWDERDYGWHSPQLLPWWGLLPTSLLFLGKWLTCDTGHGGGWQGVATLKKDQVSRFQLSNGDQVPTPGVLQLPGRPLASPVLSCPREHEASFLPLINCLGICLSISKYRALDMWGLEGEHFPPHFEFHLLLWPTSSSMNCFVVQKSPSTPRIDSFSIQTQLYKFVHRITQWSLLEMLASNYPALVPMPSVYTCSHPSTVMSAPPINMLSPRLW